MNRWGEAGQKRERGGLIHNVPFHRKGKLLSGTFTFQLPSRNVLRKSSSTCAAVDRLIRLTVPVRSDISFFFLSQAATKTDQAHEGIKDYVIITDYINTSNTIPAATV